MKNDSASFKPVISTKSVTVNNQKETNPYNQTSPSPRPSSQKTNKTYDEVSNKFQECGITRLHGFPDWSKLSEDTQKKMMIAVMDSFDYYFSDEYIDTDKIE